MAQDLVDKVEKTKRWTKTTSITKDFRIHGYKGEVEETSPFCFYGTDSKYIIQLMKDEQGMDQLLSNRISLYAAQVVWAVREEMARTVEDVLSRRVRCLLLDAREAMLIAPKVAEIMAKELNKDESWQKQQVDDFVNIASKYLLR
jgi:glycerol-3-phosphate dehydrogenase